MKVVTPIIVVDIDSMERQLEGRLRLAKDASGDIAVFDVCTCRASTLVLNVI